MPEELHRSPLEEKHRGLDAKLVPFSGWLMPLEYEGTLAEHRAVRQAAGLFDLTHLGKVEVSGDAAFDRLQRSVSNDLSRLEVGGAQYHLVLTEEGGIVDDLIVYRPEERRFLVVPNAANTDRVVALLAEGAPGGVSVAHRRDLCTVAVQGPASPGLVERLFPVAGGLGYMTCAETSYRDVPVLVARSGYTGERGFEIFVPAGAVAALWDEVLEAGRSVGPAPCGLGARDTLRLEMGYPLHGSDISERRSPVEAGLSWAVALDKGEFVGREAVRRMKESGPRVRLRGLTMKGRLIPRPHYTVFAEGRRVGETTSGTFSPTLRVGIAMAYLDADLAPGDRVEVDVRGRRGEAEVAKPPFVDASPK